MLIKCKKNFLLKLKYYLSFIKIYVPCKQYRNGVPTLFILKVTEMYDQKAESVRKKWNINKKNALNLEGYIQKLKLDIVNIAVFIASIQVSQFGHNFYNEEMMLEIELHRNDTKM